jgi:hypothetical protein
MGLWADQPNSFVQATNGRKLLGAIEFTITGTVDDPIVISTVGAPGVTVTRTDTGTYQVAFPTADAQFITMAASLTPTAIDCRKVAQDLTAGTAAFEFYTWDTGTAILADPASTSKFVVYFDVFESGTSV